MLKINRLQIAAYVSVRFSGGSSEAAGRGEPLTFAWTQTSGTSVTLSDATAEQPTFTAPTLDVGNADATLVFSLVVNDGTLDSVAETVTISVAAPANSAPTANAGADQNVVSEMTVTLDGSGSTDAETAGALTYLWRQTAGTTVTLSDATTVRPTFVAPSVLTNEGSITVTFSLVVSDGTEQSGVDTVAITIEPLALTPASEFDDHAEEIRDIVVSEAQRALLSTLSSQRELVQDARLRFAANQRHAKRCNDGAMAACAALDEARNTIPFDIDGTAELSGGVLRTKGQFFEQTWSGDGATRRLLFGNFDIQRDQDGTTSAAITGKIAWENLISDQTMLGYYVGAEVRHSDIRTAFTGQNYSRSLSVGGYGVYRLSDTIFLDGFLSFGAGRNDLDISSDTLALESKYFTQTATFGGAVTGLIEQEGYEIHPEIAISHGRTWIGATRFAGSAHGTTDDTLNLDARMVTLTTLSARPEFVFPIDAALYRDSRTYITFAPRLTCERVRSGNVTNDCGGGAEFGMSSRSEDSLKAIEFKVRRDQIGGITRTNLLLNIDYHF